jgi:hypothetical protein
MCCPQRRRPNKQPLIDIRYLKITKRKVFVFLHRIYNQIVRDAEFLSSHNIIEYSLLVGIHKCE